jgi:hypothetical protein
MDSLVIFCFLDEKRLLATSVRPSIFMEQLGSHWMDFHENWYSIIFRKSFEKSQISFKSDKNNGRFTWIKRTFMIISRSGLLRMKNFSDKICRENRIIHFRFHNLYETRAAYEIMWKNIVQPGRPQIRRAWLQIHTNDYVIFIAFPLQKCLHLHSSMLLYTYIACLVHNSLKSVHMLLFRTVR